EHANAMARKLGTELEELTGVSVAHPVEANAVFAYLPARIVPALQRHAYFYDWEQPEAEEGRRLVRLMASFDTTDADVKRFVATARRLLSAPSGAAPAPDE